MMTFTVWAYLGYLVLSVGLTIWVAKTLSKNGRVFLIDAFVGNAELAESVNRLLVVGFYLINVGFVSLALKNSTNPTDLAETIEVLSAKEGMVLLVLGAMHFMNLYVFSRVRRRGLIRNQKPPVVPEAFVAPTLGYGH